MRWGDVIKLIAENQIVNDLGDLITVRTKREVFANKKSIRQSEFYQAAAAGLKPEFYFDVRSVEYEGEQELEYEGRIYEIIRTFDKGEYIELICQGTVNKHGDA